MMLKRICCFVMALVLMLAPMGLLAYADWDDMPFVYVTIANGKHLLAYGRDRVIDTDHDGIPTVKDALITAHDEFSPIGSSTFQWKETEYGKTIIKLWGIENGTGYGYYVNNVAGTDLEAPVKEGDHVYAFVYTDNENFSDIYSYFDRQTAQIKGKEQVTLTLTALTYDEELRPVPMPVSGAYITVNGERTEYRTDENGVVSFAIDESGTVVVGAESDDMILVPPVCLVKANASYVELGFLILMFALVVAGAAFGAWYVWGRNKKNKAEVLSEE